MRRSLLHRHARHGTSPYVWLAIPVISPYTDRLKAAALDGMVCRYLVLPVTKTSLPKETP